MKKIVRWIGFVLIGLARLSIMAAWYSAWSQYRREVEHYRFVWGPEAKAPAFNPYCLANPAEMSLNTASHYILALATGVPGFLCVLLTRPLGGRKGKGIDQQA